MTSIKVKFRPSTVDLKPGTIYYQIIHKRITRQIVTTYHIMPDEWDDKLSAVKTTNRKRTDFVMSIRDNIHHDIERLKKIVCHLNKKAIDYTPDDIVDEFHKYSKEYSFFNYMEAAIIKLQENRKYSTADNYRSALNSFKKFRYNEDILIDCISSELMEQYQSWLQCRGICLNTVSFYNRIFRAVYRRAVDNEIINDRKPFKRVYTGIAKTIKRALPLNYISNIKSLNLISYPKLDYARDIFLLSFYLRGMSLIDMSFLRKSDLKNGYITYRRRKTGQRLTIAWTKEMQLILDKYPENESQYLLPIISKTGINERYTYRNAGYNLTKNLKKIGEIIMSPIPITMYVARHSWASAAKVKGIPLGVISEGMGHDNETTTRIYLASLDTSIVDKANNLIISSI